jgi:tetratricopeptide (TPR) repeat protein
VAIGWPEARSAIEQSEVREIERSLALGPSEANELRAIVRSGCAGGRVGSDGLRSLREWAYERPYSGEHTQRYEALRAEARQNEQLFPPSLGRFFSNEEARLCGAMDTVREGVRLENAGAVEAARERFLEATKVDAGNAVAFLNLGNTYLALDRLDRAKEALDQAVALASRGHEAFAAHYSRANCLARLHAQKEEVEAEIRKALDAHLEARLERPVAELPTAELLYRDLETSPEFAPLRAASRFPDDLGHPALAGTPGGPRPESR